MAAGHLDNELNKLKIDRSRKQPAKRGGGGMYLVAVAIVVVGGLFVLTNGASSTTLEVKTAKAERRKLEPGAPAAQPGSAILTATGYVIPRDKIEISSKIIGKVKEIYIEQGSKVKTGDVILRIEDEEYAAQVKIAEARVATLKAQLAELKAGSRPQEIEASKAMVEMAKSTVEKAKADLDRFEQLANDKIVSKQELDHARNAYEVALAQLNNSKKNSEMVSIGPRQELITAMEARMREAEANLEFARTQLSYTVINSPITGTILEKLAKKGELVTNTNFGGTRGAKSSVVSMADLNDLQVELDVNEDDIHKVKLEQACRIQLDSHPGVDFKGKVDEIAPQADRQKATVQVKVRIVDPGQVLRPEVNARVTFLEDEKPKETKPSSAAAAPEEPKIWIPKAAIVGSGDDAKVFIVSDGKAVARKVKLGDERDGKIEVADGLIGTEYVVTEPLDKIQDGMKVNAPQAAAPKKP